MQICRLFFAVFWNFWRITCLSTTNHRWVINAQTCPFFLAHPVYIYRERETQKHRDTQRGSNTQRERDREIIWYLVSEHISGSVQQMNSETEVFCVQTVQTLGLFTAEDSEEILQLGNTEHFPLQRNTHKHKQKYIHRHIQGGPKKNRTCFSVDNSATVSGSKTCDTSKVSECCKE